jgi:hypothetical protein
MIALGFLRVGGFIAGVCLWVSIGRAQGEALLAFKRDTFAFANETVFEYHEGHPSSRHADPPENAKRFTQHCFVMSRAVVQFRKFARFEPALRPLDDRALAVRIRQITRRPPWAAALAERERIVIPGYANLRGLSRARSDVLQENIGLGWTTYFRPGNWRILLPHGPTQQARTHRELERTLARGEFFIAYLTTIPESLSINHGVLVYAEANSAQRKRADRRRYTVYDPNHAEGPRTLEWSPRDRSFLYQRDWDFVGGRVFVWQVYGRALQ